MNDCNIVRDLFPDYIDELCSEDSKRMIENHIQQCEECSQILKVMQSDEWEEGNGFVESNSQIRKEKDDIEENYEKETELALFRVMKKVVWRRVAMMFFSILVAILAVGFLSVVVLSQFHPEWNLDFINIQQIQMRKTAKEKTKDFAEGNIEGFLEGYRNGVTDTNYSTGVDIKAVERTQKPLQEIYQQYFQGKSYTIEEEGGGYISYEDGNAIYSTNVTLSTDEITLYFYYDFLRDGIYNVACYSGSGESEKVAAEIRTWCEYLSDSFWGDKSFESITTSNDSAQEKTIYDKRHFQIISAILFTKDCTEVKSYRLLEEEYPEYIKQWGGRIYDFQKDIAFEEIWVEKEGFEEGKEKELYNIIWKFDDGEEIKGVMIKKFYYGPGGYEPVDDTEEIYGSGLTEEVVEQLEKMFD